MDQEFIIIYTNKFVEFPLHTCNNTSKNAVALYAPTDAVQGGTHIKNPRRVYLRCEKIWLQSNIPKSLYCTLSEVRISCGCLLFFTSNLKMQLITPPTRNLHMNGANLPHPQIFIGAGTFLSNHGQLFCGFRGNLIFWFEFRGAPMRGASQRQIRGLVPHPP